MPTQIKGIIYGTLLAGLAISTWYFVNKYHFSPINKLEKRVSSLQIQLDEVGRLYNICEANLSKQALQGYIDGVGENNEEPIIDFSNIVY